MCAVCENQPFILVTLAASQVIKKSLENLSRALVGEVVMNSQLEEVLCPPTPLPALLPPSLVSHSDSSHPNVRATLMIIVPAEHEGVPQGQ